MSQVYKSGRQQNLNLGITSVTESTTVLQTIGKVGIGTTNAQNHSLFVVGSTNITGDVNVGGASTFVGIATFSNDVFFGDDVFISDQLFVNGIQITGGAVIGQDLVVRNISASGISTFVGTLTNQSTIFGTQLSVSGVSTFTGLVDANGGAEIDNVRIGVLSNNTIDTSTGDLVLDSAGGTVEIDDNVLVFGSLNLIGISTFSGLVDANGGAEIDNIRIGIANDNEIDTSIGSLVLDSAGGTVEIDDNVLVFGSLNLIGISTFSGLVDANGGAEIDDVRIGILNNNTIDTSTGNLILDSAGGGVEIFDNVSVSGISTFTGLVDANGGAEIDDVRIGISNNNEIDTSTGNLILDSAGGTVEIDDDVVISGFLNVSDISTFAGITTVTGDTLFTKQLNVSGVSTFAGITTVTGPTLFSKQLNVSGVSTLAILHAPKLSPDGSDFGSAQYIIRSNGSGGWEWVNVPGIFSVNNILNGFNVSDEGSIVGTAGSITQLDFRGNNIIATANPQPNGIATIRVSDTPSFLTLTVTSGITTLGVTTTTSLFSNQLSVSGLSTFAGITTVTGDTLFAKQLNVSGVSTFTGNVTLGGELRGPAEFIIDPAGIGDNTGAVRIKGDLLVDGTQTIINSATIELADFIVGIASTATTDLLADGAGIKIGPDNTLLYDHSNTALKSSENLNLASGKTYKINGTDVLSSTTLGSGVVNSSLTSVGTLTSLNVSGLSTFAGITTVTGDTLFTKQLNVSGIATVRQLSDYKALVGAASSATETFVVTVAAKTTNHRYFGTGSASGYLIDGRESPFITLLPGKTYRFDQADASNATHQLRFYLEADKTTQHTTNVTFNGTAGSAGAYTEITVTDTTPIVLHYQCVNHGYMGNSVQTNSNFINTPYSINTLGNLNVVGITTLASAGGITTTGGDLFVNDDIFFKGNLYKNGQLFTAGIGIGSTSVNPGSGFIGQRVGTGFTDINIVGTGISVTGYGSTIVIDFGNIAAASGGTLSISTVFSPRIQDVSFVGGASTSIIGISTQTNRFVFDTQTGSVGIGTSNASIPAFKLDVVGDINSSTSVKIKGIDVLEEAVRLAIAFG